MLPTLIDEVSIRFVIEVASQPIATVNLLALSFEIFVSRRVSLSLGSLASGIYLQFSSLFPSLVTCKWLASRIVCELCLWWVEFLKLLAMWSWQVESDMKQI